MRKNYKDTISVNVPGGYKTELSKIAFQEDRAMSRVVKTAIEEYVLKKYGINLRKLDHDGSSK